MAKRLKYTFAFALLVLIIGVLLINYGIRIRRNHLPIQQQTYWNTKNQRTVACSNTEIPIAHKFSYETNLAVIEVTKHDLVRYTRALPLLMEHSLPEAEYLKLKDRATRDDHINFTELMKDIAQAPLDINTIPDNSLRMFSNHVFNTEVPLTFDQLKFDIEKYITEHALDKFAAFKLNYIVQCFPSVISHLLQDGKTRIFDKRSNQHVDQYTVANFSYYNSPLCAGSGKLFQFFGSEVTFFRHDEIIS